MLRKLVLVVAAAGVVAACGGGSSGDSLSSHSSKPQTISLSEKDNGKTVNAHVGDKVVVTLHNTYWQLSSSPSAVLVPMAAGVDLSTASASPCPAIPGTGCGTITRGYHVAGSGTATISGHRNSCGEALRCSADQSSWKVTVVAQ